MTQSNELRKPFGAEHISQRSQGGKNLSYVEWARVLERVIDCTGNGFGWEVMRCELAATDKGAAYWWVHGRLSVPELGTRDGIGTAVLFNEDSVKSAESDAFKRAASKFGAALHLYLGEDMPGTPVQPQQRAPYPSGPVQPGVPTNGAGVAANGRPLNPGPDPCNKCHAPAGKAHATGCIAIAEQVPA